MIAFIDLNRCPVQLAMCKPIKECPNQAILYSEDENAMMGAKMVVDTDLCKGCGNYIIACCGDAISIIEN